MKIFNATKQDAGRTIIKFLQKVLLDVPKSRIEKLFRKKDIKLNGKRDFYKNYKIQENDEIIVYGIEFKVWQQHTPSKPVFDVVFEDENILLVNKPINISIHDERNCLDNQVLTYLDWVKTGSFSPSHIGRIDKVTSGIVIYGKTYEALRMLKEHQLEFTKIYCYQSDFLDDIETNYKIGHDEIKKRMCIHPKGNLTKTKFFREDGMQLAQIFTGKKHQIRVSLAKLKVPIYGDTKYGGRKDNRVYLHSYKLTLNGLHGKLEYLNGMTFVSKPKW